MQAEHNRLIANTLKQGNIAQCDAAKGLVRVQCGALLSDWLPYFVPFAGAVSVHRPPSVGENCLLLSPSGEMGNGLVLCGLASSQFPSPSGSPDETVMIFPDGARFEYNHVSGSLRVSGIKTAVIEAAQSMTFDTPEATFTGKVTAQGLLTYQAGMMGSNGAGGASATITGDLVHKQGQLSSNGVVLDSHIHTETNGSETGGPK